MNLGLIEIHLPQALTAATPMRFQNCCGPVISVHFPFLPFVNGDANFDGFCSILTGFFGGGARNFLIYL